MVTRTKSRLLFLVFALFLAREGSVHATSEVAKDKVSAPVEPQKARPVIEVAFVLDTTSSMTGLIEGAKQKVWSIASKIARGQPTPRLKVGLVAFRDVGDEYVTRRFDLTENLDAVFNQLRGFRAEGGGDTPEHVGRGLGEAVKLLSWSQDKKTMKMIFLVGDAPPQRYNDDWDYRVWAKRAIERGIVVNTVRCGGATDTEVAWKEIARLGDGSYASIEQGGGMLAVSTPYDAKLAELNSAIASKSVYTGGVAARAEAKGRARMVADMPAEAAADRLGFLSTAGIGSSGAGEPASAAPMAVAGSVDVTAAPALVERAKDEELPDELRSMDKAQRKAHVEKLSKERRALEDKALSIAKERQAWIDQNAAERDDSFDAKVMKDVKGRAMSYGVTY
jgi:hypothetical protein